MEVFVAAIARRPAPDEVTTADLLLAIIDTPNCVGRNALLGVGADIEALRSAALDALAEDDPVWIANGPGVWTITVNSDDPDVAWSPQEAD